VNTSANLRFGPFELDPASGELRKFGRRIRIRPQASRVLAFLISRAGEVVSREELYRTLWGDSTVVDFEHGLNFCIRQIRTALGEQATKPRYLETIPRAGYRFKQQTPEPFRSLVVLPFENASGDAELDYLSDGITDTLIRQLALLPQLRVIARATSFRFKGRATNPLTIGRRLNVAAVLTGRVLQRGTQLQISVDLVDTATGAQMWGEQYDRAADDVLRVQQEISSEIASKLHVRLRTDPRPATGRWGTDDSDAYRLYLKGRYFVTRWTGEGFRKAIEYFNEAIARDPLYALAYAGLADCYGPLGFYGYLPPTDSWPKAKAAALRALDIDDDLAEARVSLATVGLFYEWDREQAHRECVRAQKLNPGYPAAWLHDATALIALGRFDEGLASIRKANELDPLSPWLQTVHGLHLYFARRYDDAERELRAALELEPHYGEAHRVRGVTLVQQGRLDEAISELRAARTALGDSPAALGSLGRACALSGRRDEARALIALLESVASQKRVAAASIAAIHVGLGEHDEAIEWLLRAVENRSSWLVVIEQEPWWDPLRAHPRFAEVLRRMGFA
jgi:TolB-like protein/Flp pilus assembly protein TadD